MTREVGAQTSDHLSNRMTVDGFAVLRVNDLGSSVATKSMELQLNAIGRPITIFSQLGLWRPIGVKLDKHPNQSEGVGTSPLHMDFVNAFNPPDYVCLICVRRDPLGGGATILAPVAAAGNISERHRRVLRRAIFHDGRVVDLDNVGMDINPFAVVRDGDFWSFRYTRNLLSNAQDYDVIEALKALDYELSRTQRTIPLAAGEAIVFDQHHWVHGKTPLGNKQQNLPPDERRLLLQAFCRDANNPLV